ncbi:MAG: hypothetical protein JNM84_03250 [Planctomycetes bacterium]|nr:hypothetical protein [Planctomycetota bacterium]
MGRRKKGSKKASAGAADAAVGGAGSRGRKADPVETARRVEALKRVEAGEINNNEAADSLGLKIGTWAVWKSNYLKRQSGGGKAKAKAAKAPKAAAAPKAAKAAKAGKPGKTAKAASAGTANLDSLQGLVAHLQGVQSFGQELKAQLQSLLDLVERQFGS